MEGLIKFLSTVFSGIAFILVAVVTIVNRLSLLVVLKRSLIAALVFGVLGGIIGYLLIYAMETSDSQSGLESNKTEEMSSVSKQQAAQQYAEQGASEKLESEAEEKETNNESDDEFEPLNLEEVDYDELEEAEELSDQDPEKLAQVMKGLQQEE